MNLRQTMAPFELTMNQFDYQKVKLNEQIFRKFQDCKEFLQKNDADYPSMALYKVREGMMFAFCTMCQNYTVNVSSK
jgi:hypothetical protein